MKASVPNTEASRAVPPWERNTVRWVPGESAFPMSHYDRPGKLFALGVTLAGLAAVYLPAQAVYHDLRAIGWQWSLLILRLPFLLTGMGMTVFGASRFYARRLYTLRKEEVECDEIGMFGRSHWKESTRKYEGTLKQIKFYSGGRAGRARCYYEVLLKHPDPDRSVVLMRCYSWTPVEEAWRRFAKLFSLHALERTPKGMTKLSPRDLDARQSAGDLSGWIDPGGFSKGLAVKADGGFYEIRFADRLPALPRLVSAVAWGVFSYWILTKFGPVWSALPALGILGSLKAVAERLFGSEVIRIASAGAEYLRESPFGTRPVSQLPAELLTNCLLRKVNRLGRTCVVLEAGGESLAFGGSLSSADKQKLRDLSILVLSQGPARFDLAG